MADQIKILRDRIGAIEEEMEAEFERRRNAFILRFEGRRAVFAENLETRQKALRTALGTYLASARPMVILTAPFIYAIIVPFVLLDLLVTLYQAVCFPVYGIQKVRRSDHIVFDRHRLRYLNELEKLNCTYCAYGNGLLSYATEIASRTEEYWCPIKHAARLETAHRRYPDFAEYGDAEGYRERLARIAQKRLDTAG